MLVGALRLHPRTAHGRTHMKWVKPVVQESCVGMEVTSYESAEIDPEILT
jgi:coenzyme PQQ precursor peptide PqqA